MGLLVALSPLAGCCLRTLALQQFQPGPLQTLCVKLAALTVNATRRPPTQCAVNSNLYKHAESFVHLPFLRFFIFSSMARSWPSLKPFTDSGSGRQRKSDGGSVVPLMKRCI